MSQDQATVRDRDMLPGAADDPGKTTFISLTVGRKVKSTARDERYQVRGRASKVACILLS